MAFQSWIFKLAHRDKFGRPTFGRKWVRRDPAEAAAPKLSITLPLALRREDGYFVIIDGAGRDVASVDFEDDETQRHKLRLFSQDEAREVALTIARLLSDVESAPTRSGPTTIPLDELNAENDE